EVVMACGNEGKVREWETATGKLIREWDANGVPRMFSPDGKFVVGNFNAIRVWDWHTGKILNDDDGAPDSILSVAFSPDGRRLLSLGKSERSVRVWDLGATKSVATEPFEPEPKNRYTDRPFSARFSPDVKTLVLGSNAGQFRVANSETGKFVQQFGF